MSSKSINQNVNSPNEFSRKAEDSRRLEIVKSVGKILLPVGDRPTPASKIISFFSVQVVCLRVSIQHFFHKNKINFRQFYS